VSRMRTAGSCRFRTRHPECIRSGVGAFGVSEERRCLVIDEHPTVRLGVRRLLADRYEVEEAEDGRGAMKVITSLGEFDVAIVELAPSAPGTSGIPAIRKLRKAKPGLGIVAHGSRAEKHAAAEALEAGATAYVAKSSPPEALATAVDSAVAAKTYIDPAALDGNGNGGPALTRRQREILQHYADGRSTAEVAERLGLSTETIRTHTKAALHRLEANDRAHAVAIGLRSSLIE
jgi:two-component system, NarL family, response regulator